MLRNRFAVTLALIALPCMTASRALSGGVEPVRPATIAEDVLGWQATSDGGMLTYRLAEGMRLHLPGRDKTIEIEPPADYPRLRPSAAMLDANTVAWTFTTITRGGELSGMNLTVRRLPDGPMRMIHPTWGRFLPIGRTGGDSPRLLVLVQPPKRGADANVLSIDPTTLESGVLATIEDPGAVHTHRLAEDGRTLTIWTDPPREEMTPAKRYDPAESHEVRRWTIDLPDGRVRVERRDGKDMPPPADPRGRPGARPTVDFPLIGRSGKVTFTGDEMLIERFGVTGKMFGGAPVQALLPGPPDKPRRLAADVGSGEARAVWIVDLKTAASLKLREIGPLDSLKGYGPEGRYLVYEHFSGKRTGDAANGTLVVHDHNTRTDLTIHPRAVAKYVNYVGFAGPGWLAVSANQWHDGAIRGTSLGLIDLHSGDPTPRPVLTGKLLKWEQVAGALFVSDYDGQSGTYTLYRVDPPKRSESSTSSDEE